MGSKDLYAERKSKGLCIQCGDPVVSEKPSQARCQTCLDKNKINKKLNRTKKKLKGECTECTNQAEPDHAMCRKCIDQRSNESSKRYFENKLAGKCRVCGKNSGGETRCPEHKRAYDQWRRKNNQ